MYWQVEQYRLGRSLTLNTVDKIDLPDHGMLGSIMLVIHSKAETNGLDAQIKILPEEHYTKFRVIVNGSHEVKSLDMKALQLVNFLDQHIFKPDKNGQYGHAWNRSPLHQLRPQAVRLSGRARSQQVQHNRAVDRERYVLVQLGDHPG